MMKMKSGSHFIQDSVCVCVCVLLCDEQEQEEKMNYVLI